MATLVLLFSFFFSPALCSHLKWFFLCSVLLCPSDSYLSLKRNDKVFIDCKQCLLDLFNHIVLHLNPEFSGHMCKVCYKYCRSLNTHVKTSWSSSLHTVKACLLMAFVVYMNSSWNVKHGKHKVERAFMRLWMALCNFNLDSRLMCSHFSFQEKTVTFQPNFESTVAWPPTCGST